METKTNFGVKVLIAVVFVVAMISVVFWSMGYGFTSQSLNNQVNALTAENENLRSQVTNLQSHVTTLQNQVNSLATQLVEKETEIEYVNSKILETVYGEDMSNILEWLYPPTPTDGTSRHAFLTR